MPRPPSPEVRRTLIEQAAAMLARREPVTLRAVAAAAGVSTMAVYTYFDGMPGLWGAVRQEGFVRLGERLAGVSPDPDPVRHLADLGVAYVENGTAHPDLYRLMFESIADLPDPGAAQGLFDVLTSGVSAAQQDGRFGPQVSAADTAARVWAVGHGLTSLAAAGVLPLPELRRHAVAITAALFVAAGDLTDRAHRPVSAAWRSSE